MQKDEMPIGFSMALAQNPEAMKRFALMSESEKQAVINGVHSVKSKEAMQQYVNNLIPES